MVSEEHIGQQFVGRDYVAKAAGVGPSAVSNWMKRDSSFPKPALPGRTPHFHKHEVDAWLVRRNSTPSGNGWPDG